MEGQTLWIGSIASLANIFLFIQYTSSPNFATSRLWRHHCVSVCVCTHMHVKVHMKLKDSFKAVGSSLLPCFWGRAHCFHTVCFRLAGLFSLFSPGITDACCPHIWFIWVLGLKPESCQACKASASIQRAISTAVFVVLFRDGGQPGFKLGVAEDSLELPT